MDYKEVVDKIRIINIKQKELNDLKLELGIKSLEHRISYCRLMNIIRDYIEKGDLINFLIEILPEVSFDTKMEILNWESGNIRLSFCKDKPNKEDMYKLSISIIDNILNEDLSRICKININKINSAKLINYIINTYLEKSLNEVKKEDRLNLIMKFSSSKTANNIKIYQALDKILESKKEIDDLFSISYNALRFNNLYKKYLRYHKDIELNNINKVKTYLDLSKDHLNN